MDADNSGTVDIDEIVDFIIQEYGIDIDDER